LTPAGNAWSQVFETTSLKGHQVATLRASGTETIALKSGTNHGRQFVRVGAGMGAQDQVLLTARVAKGKVEPDGMGPFFLATSNVLPGLNGFDIWVQAIDQQSALTDVKIEVDWLVVGK
jgi:hypothetical protein